MSSDVYRRAGRGGAGNFFSKADIENQAKAAQEDVEAQKLGAVTAEQVAAASVPIPGSYARAGRGGAGNFYETSTKAQQLETERDVAEKIRVAAAKQGHKHGLTGRGGMGNWTDTADTQAFDEDEEKRRHDLEAKVLQDVEAGLKMPTPSYQGARPATRN